MGSLAYRDKKLLKVFEKLSNIQETVTFIKIYVKYFVVKIHYKYSK